MSVDTAASDGALLSIRGVTKTFSGLTALEDVSFEVQPGQIKGVIGPNGAGKTTLFNVIAGSFPPTAGEVLLRGKVVTGLPSHRIARAGIARTYQLMKPFGTLSVRDNVLIAALQRTGSMKEARVRAGDVVERVGLASWADDQAAGLSTAGRKRLELARALALEPDLLLLDEVLAGLVPSERAPVMELLAEIRRGGVTMLFVEHVMAAVMELSDEIVVLHHGQVLATGTPDQVTSDPAVVEAYLGEEQSDADA
ncbi:MAG: ABC transporter ATP-binding protein [Nitriliruptoraceae bacterium]